MHPQALLDVCAELVRLTLKFDHPADAIVSRFFRDHRGLGPRERATLAETVYNVLRKKLLFDKLALSGSGPEGAPPGHSRLLRPARFPEERADRAGESSGWTSATRSSRKNCSTCIATTCPNGWCSR